MQDQNMDFWLIFFAIIILGFFISFSYECFKQWKTVTGLKNVLEPHKKQELYEARRRLLKYVISFLAIVISVSFSNYQTHTASECLHFLQRYNLCDINEKFCSKAKEYYHESDTILYTAHLNRCDVLPLHTYKHVKLYKISLKENSAQINLAVCAILGFFAYIAIRTIKKDYFMGTKTK